MRIFIFFLFLFSNINLTSDHNGIKRFFALLGAASSYYSYKFLLKQRSSFNEDWLILTHLFTSSSIKNLFYNISPLKQLLESGEEFNFKENLPIINIDQNELINKNLATPDNVQETIAHLNTLNNYADNFNNSSEDKNAGNHLIAAKNYLSSILVNISVLNCLNSIEPSHNFSKKYPFKVLCTTLVLYLPGCIFNFWRYTQSRQIIPLAKDLKRQVEDKFKLFLLPS